MKFHPSFPCRPLTFDSSFQEVYHTLLPLFIDPVLFPFLRTMLKCSCPDASCSLTHPILQKSSHGNQVLDFRKLHHKKCRFKMLFEHTNDSFPEASSTTPSIHSFFLDYLPTSHIFPQPAESTILILYDSSPSIIPC